MSIRCGRGEAYLLMKENPDIDFTKEIYKASIKNYAYDGQSEGDRAEYIIQFLERLDSDQYNKLKEKISRRLFEEEKDTWDLKQIFKLCGYFALNDQSIKKRIYKRFKQTPIPDSDWLGTETILKLDGAKGMINIAEHFGKKLIENKDNWQDDSLVNSFDKQHPKIKIKQLLKKESVDNIYIRKYLKEIESTRKRWDTYKRSRDEWTYDKIVEHILDDNKTGSSYSIIRELKDKEGQIFKIAKLLKRKQSIKTINKLLYIFTYFKYPFSIEDLKEYQKKKYKSWTRGLAFEALCMFKDKGVRAQAIKKLESTNNPAKYIAALKRNYEKGDSKLIGQTIRRFNDEHIVEQLGISLCEVYEHNNTKECKEPLLLLYRKMNCGIHRKSIICILLKNKVLPKSILKEMRFDSYRETRELYTKIKELA